jgi:hypothetical protein
VKTTQPGSEDRAGQPHHRGANHTQGTSRPPEYVVEAWISEQLRARIQRNTISHAERLQAANAHITHRQARAPQADLEAER